MNDMLKTGIKVLKVNSPTVLTALSITGLIGTVLFMAEAVPVAMQIIENEEQERTTQWDKYNPLDQDEAISFPDKFKLTWKTYTPTFIMGMITVGCMIGSNSINMRRNAALTSAYALAEGALREYKTKVVEVIGANKEKAIRDDISKDRITNNPHSGNTVVFTGKGEHLCYDPACGNYFHCDIQTIRKAVNELNLRLPSEMFISLNDFYYEVGIPASDAGDSLGWNIDDGMIIIDFSSHVTDKDEPCLVLDFLVKPKPNFY